MDTLYIVKEFWSQDTQTDGVVYDEAYDITVFRKEDLAISFAKEVFAEYENEFGFEGVAVYTTSIHPQNNLVMLHMQQKETTQV